MIVMGIRSRKNRTTAAKGRTAGISVACGPAGRRRDRHQGVATAARGALQRLFRS